MVYSPRLGAIAQAMSAAGAEVQADLTKFSAPPEVVRRLHTELAVIMQNQELRQRLNGMGYEVSFGTTEQFAQRIRSETGKWPAVVKAMGGPIN